MARAVVNEDWHAALGGAIGTFRTQPRVKHPVDDKHPVDEMMVPYNDRLINC
jgi:hypothetical protein